jgi:DNA-directed RNA polymerase subunit RPC12/RpoP
MRTRTLTTEFRCLHCRQVVPLDPARSGVRNRNHCPYCLWSRHLDLYHAGDRLSACKGGMQPVGLALKRVSKKYPGDYGGELLLIHQCQECGRLSLNRIAADDFAERLFDIYHDSLQMELPIRQQLEAADVLALQPADQSVVRARLFGYHSC